MNSLEQHKHRALTLGSLFDGIGGFPYAGLFYGIKPLWASEILPQAVSITMKQFPDMEHVGDLTQLNGAILTPVDIITFGSPCQDLSTAGRRAGLNGERSNLFYEAIRIIDEMRCATNGKYPKYAVWENVPGALSSGKPRGSDFRAVIEAFTKTEVPMPDSGGWANAGLLISQKPEGHTAEQQEMGRGDSVSIAWRILNAQYYGVPQRRRRIFLVASFGAGCPGEILFVEEGLRRHSSPCCQARQRIATDVEGCVRGTVQGKSRCLTQKYDSCGVEACSCILAFAANQRDEVRNLGSASGVLQAQPGMKQQTFVAQKPQRCLNPWETQQSRVFTEGCVSPTLAGADGGGGRNPARLIIQNESSNEDNDVAAFLKEPSANARSIGYSTEVSPTLKSSSPCLCEKRAEYTMVYGLCANNSNSMLSANPNSGVYKADTSRTLDQNGGNPACNQGGMLVLESISLQETQSAVVLNDQGGDSMSVEKSDISPTLRCETHGHMPIVAKRDTSIAYGVHQGQGGDVNVSETAYSLTTNSSASSRNAPLITQKKLDDGTVIEGQCDPTVLTLCKCVHPKVTGTLVASGAGLSRPGGMASEPDLCVAYEQPVYSLQGNMIGRKDHNGPQGSGINEEVCFTVTATDVSGVAAVFSKLRSDHLKEVYVACTQTARQYKEATDLVCERQQEAGDVSAVDCRNYKEIGDISGTLQAKDKPGYSLNYQNPVRISVDCTDDSIADTCYAEAGFGGLKEDIGVLCTRGSSNNDDSESLATSQDSVKYIVRRLTPTECERLQGFPDGWTKYGHDGKEISDTKRYQMLGNSVAIPCVAFVLGNIAAKFYGGGDTVGICSCT